MRQLARLCFGSRYRRQCLTAAILVLVFVQCLPKMLNYTTISDISKPQTGRKIIVPESMYHEYSLAGSLFKEDGSYRYVSSQSSTCLLHSFSPSVENLAAQKFLDPAKKNKFYTNSPALEWHRGKLVLVARIWLGREKYEEDGSWTPNHFADNYLFTQTFDRQLRALDNGKIMGIPAPKQWWVGDGPIEPRLFKHGEDLLVSFNIAVAFAHNDSRDFTMLWDYDRNLPTIPRIKGGSPMINATHGDAMPRDKHWMPFEKPNNKKLHFVHNLDPMRVLSCDKTGHCEFVNKDIGKNGFIFQRHKSHLRGGTPFSVYHYPYFVGVAHCTLYQTDNHHRHYSAHVVVFHAEQNRIVYISNSIQIDPYIYKATPIVRKKYIDKGFIFPVGLILEDHDNWALSVHVNDYSSVLLRMKGMKNIIDSVISIDKETKPKKGPPPGYLHSYMHDMMEKTTNIKFDD